MIAFRAVELRRSRAWQARMLVIFALGTALGSVVIGLGASMIGSLGSAEWPRFVSTLLAYCGGLALLYGAGELAGAKLPLPTSPWLVPRTWGNVGESFATMVFGVALGLGVVTKIRSFAFYVVLAAAVAAESVSSGVILMLVFGAGRVAPVIVAVLADRAIPNQVSRMALRNFLVVRLVSLAHTLSPIRTACMLTIAVLFIRPSDLQLPFRAVRSAAESVRQLSTQSHQE